VPHLRCSMTMIAISTQRFRGWAHVWLPGLRPSKRTGDPIIENADNQITGPKRQTHAHKIKSQITRQRQTFQP
jgi:hypothetical protein